MSNKILSVSADAKTIKGTKKGVLTGVLYLAPHNISGFQVCPKASEGCKLACLYTAGRGIYSKVQNARINKTKRFFTDRVEFMNDLVYSVNALIRKAKRLNYIPAVRLNGTSDIAWEKMAVERDGKYYKNIMAAFPNVQFYDYTAIIGRKAALAIPNYHLTFSLKENNDKDAIKALEQGYNVAVVMNKKRKESLPVTWAGIAVIDGDKDDLRFKDGKGGKIVGLRRKGAARHDTSGFVRDALSGFKA